MGRKKKDKEKVSNNTTEDFDEFEIDSRCKDVTKEEFEIYKKIKDEDEIPLYEIRKIIELTGINSYKLTKIMDNYSKLCNKFINNNKCNKKENKND